MPILNYYTLSLPEINKQLMEILSKDIVEKVVIHKSTNNNYIAVFNVFFVGVDRNSGWIELLPNGTFQKQPKLRLSRDVFPHHISDQKWFDSVVDEHDLIKKLNDWAKTVETKYEIKPKIEYPPVYTRPMSKGQKFMLSKQ